MRRRRRKSRQMKLIVIGSICILSVMTVGYAAFGTSLDISAKGKIVKNETTSETIKNKYCNASSGDGLYKDTLEEGRCIYRGSNPNNYITFNGEDAGWRIVSIENDGTMKIMKMDSLGNMRFDTEKVRYQGSTGYCNVNSSDRGCKVWGSASTMLDASGNNVTSMPREINGTEYPLPAEEAQITKYLNNDYYGTLTDEAKGQIDTHLWNVGPLDSTNKTLEADVSQEKAYKWRGKIGVINTTDYVRASTYATCTTVYSANTIEYPCKNNNYMYNSSISWWTMSPYSGSNSHLVLRVSVEGDITEGYAYGNVRPALYLTSKISLDGNGTEEDPYVIK